MPHLVRAPAPQRWAHGSSSEAQGWSRLALILATVVGAACSSQRAQEPTRHTCPLGTATWEDRQLSDPGPRFDHAMAYDESRGRIVLFGGQTDYSTYLDDTWEYDGAHWSQPQLSGGSPPARGGHSLVFDASRGKLVLFGGKAGTTTYLDDTWEYDGLTATWTPLAPAQAPTPRSNHGAAYDTNRGVVVLYGGRDTLCRKETWEWSGTAGTWTKREPAVQPDACQSQSLTYDDRRATVILFGGIDVVAREMQETWEWDGYGGTWTERAPTLAPGKRSCHGAAVDRGRQQLVIFAGVGNDFLGDTWEFDGPTITWAAQATALAPSPRRDHAMVYDASRGRIVLYGGMGPLGAVIGDTWEYFVADLPNGTPCTEALAGRCASGECVDRVCCAVATCPGTCRSCNVAGSAGVCADVPAGEQDDDTCTGTLACDGTGGCTKQVNGTTCSTGDACASGFCADDVCCDTACLETCRACDLAGHVGECSMVPPYQEDQGAAVPCLLPDFCDGLGDCKPAASCLNDTECPDGPCVDNVCCENTCPFTCFSCAVPGLQGLCAPLPPQSEDNATTLGYPTCQVASGGMCDGVGNCLKASGQTCTGANECASGYCVEGYCCDSACDGNCDRCNDPTAPGSCRKVPTGTDPRLRCQAAEGGAPACAGTCGIEGQCVFPDIGTPCDICSACDGTGRCNAMPPDDLACGIISCSGLNTPCRIYDDLTTNRCSAPGFCKAANDPGWCDSWTDLSCDDAGTMLPPGSDAAAAGAPSGASSSGASCTVARGGWRAPGGVLLLALLGLVSWRHRVRRG